MEFNEKLIYVRAKLNLSQTELAKELKVSTVTICRWETGKVKPNKKAEYVLEQYCKDKKILIFNDGEGDE